MQIILLSGGSGSRLWPLSNEARSKQFLKILDVDGSKDMESMIQRVYRQLNEADINAKITVATCKSQIDSVISQLGEEVDIVSEPSRRDTFPAISLTCEYLSKEKKCANDEIVVVMPCDPYTQAGYFEVIKRMAKGIQGNKADLIIMGINPTYPSAKYGYVKYDQNNLDDTVLPVTQFIEKPQVKIAEKLISENALWNGGVFAFRLGYVNNISRKYNCKKTFAEIKKSYQDYPPKSFDYEVVERAQNIGMVRYDGQWKDLGTWNTLTDELKKNTYGNVITDETAVNTHIINELNTPLVCLGTKNLLIAASPDGIIVTEKSKSENIKNYIAKLHNRPMFEERRWGTYRVIDSMNFPDGFCTLTKQLTLNPGCSISYQRHTYRDEIWTFIDGEGLIVIDGEKSVIRRGDTVYIRKGQLHTLKAATSLSFIEIQSGSNLIEEDIERFNFDW